MKMPLTSHDWEWWVYTNYIWLGDGANGIVKNPHYLLQIVSLPVILPNDHLIRWQILIGVLDDTDWIFPNDHLFNTPIWSITFTNRWSWLHVNSEKGKMLKDVQSMGPWVPFFWQLEILGIRGEVSEVTSKKPIFCCPQKKYKYKILNSNEVLKNVPCSIFWGKYYTPFRFWISCKLGRSW